MWIDNLVPGGDQSNPDFLPDQDPGDAKRHQPADLRRPQHRSPGLDNLSLRHILPNMDQVLTISNGAEDLDFIFLGELSIFQHDYSISTFGQHPPGMDQCTLAWCNFERW